MPVRGWEGAPGGLYDGVVNLSHTGSRVQRTGGQRTPAHRAWNPATLCGAIVRVLVFPRSPFPVARGVVPFRVSGERVTILHGPSALHSSNNPQRDTDNTVGMVRPGLSCKVPVDVVPIGGSSRCLPPSALLVLRRTAGGACAATSRRADGGSGRDIDQLID